MSRWEGGGGGGGGGGRGRGGGGGEWRSISLLFENSIVLIKCTLYDTVFQREVSISRGVAFFYYFVIYCAANHGIWCSVYTNSTSRTMLKYLCEPVVTTNPDISMKFGRL